MPTTANTATAPFPWCVTLLLVANAAFEDVFMGDPGAYMLWLIRDLRLNNTLFLAGGIICVGGTGVGGVLVSGMARRWDRPRAIVVGTLVAAITHVFSSLGRDFLGFILPRAVMAVGLSVVVPFTVDLLHSLLPAEHVPRALSKTRLSALPPATSPTRRCACTGLLLGIKAAAMPVVTIVGGALSARLHVDGVPDSARWREQWWMLSAVGACVSVLLYCVVREPRSAVAANSIVDEEHARTQLRSTDDAGGSAIGKKEDDTPAAAHMTLCGEMSVSIGRLVAAVRMSAPLRLLLASALLATTGTSMEALVRLWLVEERQMSSGDATALGGWVALAGAMVAAFAVAPGVRLVARHELGNTAHLGCYVMLAALPTMALLPFVRSPLALTVCYTINNVALAFVAALVYIAALEESHAAVKGAMASAMVFISSFFAACVATLAGMLTDRLVAVGTSEPFTVSILAGQAVIASSLLPLWAAARQMSHGRARRLLT